MFYSFVPKIPIRLKFFSNVLFLFTINNMLLQRTPIFKTIYSTIKSTIFHLHFPYYYAKSPRFSTPNSTTHICYRYSVSNNSHGQQDSRKLLQISQSIIPVLLQKNDIASITEIIHQMAQTLITELFHSNRAESKKVLTFIYQLIGSLWQHLTYNQLQSLEKTLKLLTLHVEEINDTELIIATNEIYVKIIEKKDGKHNAAYMQALSNLAQNCIHGDLIDRAFQCLTEVQSLGQTQAISINSQILIQNLLNLGIIHLSKGDNQASITAYTKALELTKQINSPQHLQVAIYECLGDIYKNCGQFQKGLEFYQHSLNTYMNIFSKIDINAIILMYKTSNTFFQLHRYNEAVELCQKIEKYLQNDNSLLEEFEYYEEIFVLMGECQQKISNLTLAILYYEKYIVQAEKSIIIKQKMYISTINRLIDLYLQQNRPQKALKHLKSLTKYHKIQGNQSLKQQCQQRAKQIEASLLI